MEMNGDSQRIEYLEQSTATVKRAAVRIKPHETFPLAMSYRPSKFGQRLTGQSAARHGQNHEIAIFPPLGKKSELPRVGIGITPDTPHDEETRPQMSSNVERKYRGQVQNIRRVGRQQSNVIRVLPLTDK